MLQEKNKIKKSGFSLIEMLVVVFIIAVVFTSFYTAATLGTKHIVEAKNKLGAVAFLNEKVEIVRNLKYDDVGTSGGVPNGKILENEDVSANGRLFHVHSLVQYIDDPLDGEFPEDTIPNDYKVVKIVVSWKDSSGNNQEISSVARFVPPGLETDDGGAPLAINVKGSNGEPVRQAQVHIVNNDVSPALNFTVQTDDVGHIMLPSAPESLSGYQISVSKNAHEKVQTLDSPAVDYKGNSYDPIYTHATVLLGGLNMYDYIQDKLSKITIKTTDYKNAPVGNISFTLDGGKVLGLDSADANVYNLHDSGVTEVETGQKEYAEISPGNYEIKLGESVQYEFADYSQNASSVALSPGTEMIYEVKLADKNVDGILVKVADNVSGLPIADAKISLKDLSGNDIFMEKMVSENGVLYYPDAEGTSVSGKYTLKIEAINYVTQEMGVDINKLTKKDVKLIGI